MTWPSPVSEDDERQDSDRGTPERRREAARVAARLVVKRGAERGPQQTGHAPRREDTAVRRAEPALSGDLLGGRREQRRREAVLDAEQRQTHDHRGGSREPPR